MSPTSTNLPRPTSFCFILLRLSQRQSSLPTYSSSFIALSPALAYRLLMNANSSFMGILEVYAVKLVCLISLSQNHDEKFTASETKQLILVFFQGNASFAIKSPQFQAADTSIKEQIIKHTKHPFGRRHFPKAEHAKDPLDFVELNSPDLSILKALSSSDITPTVPSRHFHSSDLPTAGISIKEDIISSYLGDQSMQVQKILNGKSSTCKRDDSFDRLSQAVDDVFSSFKIEQTPCTSDENPTPFEDRDYVDEGCQVDEHTEVLTSTISEEHILTLSHLLHHRLIEMIENCHRLPSVHHSSNDFVLDDLEDVLATILHTLASAYQLTTAEALHGALISQRLLHVLLVTSCSQSLKTNFTQALIICFFLALKNSQDAKYRLARLGRLFMIQQKDLAQIERLVLSAIQWNVSISLQAFANEFETLFANNNTSKETPNTSFIPADPYSVSLDSLQPNTSIYPKPSPCLRQTISLA
ncbi:hypothetical protein BLNAU_8996 [Blattamonas nauphoetae]|uniref:Uncharacterized protein n=1 Tax=Blattamonas nauphoetae TaxID=2049346 RepID=A0ABQ9XX18_9EUKA|nr:hypothetical protein BLNAU_8996 [Blattamonas nauphoetae]